MTRYSCHGKIGIVGRVEWVCDLLEEEDRSLCEWALVQERRDVVQNAAHFQDTLEADEN